MNHYVRIPKELIIETKEYGNIRLISNGRLISGTNDLSYIKWFSYTIENCDKLREKYDCIAVSFSRITYEILEDATKRIVKTGVSNEPTPNIDSNTGNIHASKNNETKVEPKKVQQLVLCHGTGPQKSKFIDSGDYYCYQAVHKACYYPLICDDKSLHSNYRYKILEQVWKKLQDKELVEQ